VDGVRRACSGSRLIFTDDDIVPAARTSRTATGRRSSSSARAPRAPGPRP
jgi:hypothetical protein